MTTEKKPGRKRDTITIDRRDQIVALINRWTLEWGKLTGPNLEKRVESSLKLKLTRQGMFNHEPILTAFTERNRVLTGNKPKRVRPVEAELAAKRLKAREAEILRLSRIVDGYEERFVRYVYNAKMKGVTVEDLERPLPARESD
jgi:hypothetical protein